MSRIVAVIAAVSPLLLSALVAGTLPMLALTPSVVGAQPAPAITAITASWGTGYDGHTCALTSAGTVLCWGNNDFGQLGDGSTVDRVSPVTVKGLSGRVVAVAAGGYHTCALTSSGGVECWGINVRGQLGDGTGRNSRSPVAVSGLASGVSAIASGAGGVCALTSSGGVKCWGMVADDSLVPLDSEGLEGGVTAIAAGLIHACAISFGGGVKCWGDDDWGQLGDGKTAEQGVPMSETPVQVVGLDSGVIAIAAGDAHTCALTEAGGVKCWGASLANGAEHNSDVPIDVPGLDRGLASIATAYWHTCVTTSLGEVECWGLNDSGQLGDGTRDSSRVPVKVGALANGNIAVAPGGHHTCAITSARQVKCWGSNLSGQLGDGTTTDRLTPVDVVFELTPSPPAPTPPAPPPTETLSGGHEAGGELPSPVLVVGLAALVVALVTLRRPHWRPSRPTGER